MFGKLLTFASILEKRKLQPPLLYGISDRHCFPNLDPFHYLELLFGTRAHLIQWREKDLAPEANRPFVQYGTQLARKTGKLFILNSHVEVALEEAADGVHLTSQQDAKEALDLRKRFGVADFAVGKSVHTVHEAERAERNGADYVMLGPIFEPLSKPSDLQPLGLSALREAAQMLYIPVFPVGGVDETTWPEVGKTNAIGIAGITWIRRAIESLLAPGRRGTETQS